MSEGGQVDRVRGIETGGLWERLVSLRKTLLGAFGIKFVVLFGVVMAIFADVKLLVMYQLALEKKAFIAVLAVGTAAEITGIMLFHRSLPAVLNVILVVGLLLLLLANLGLALA